MIDVIIPAYNAHETINRCLASIAMQSLASQCIVTIVDDASDKKYYDLVKLWQPFLKINVIRAPENIGPGRARQLGYDNTNSNYVTFIDADDTFASSLSLEYLMRVFKENSSYCVACGTFQEQVDKNLVPHETDLIWMFGKMYKRAFLDKYNIRFSDDNTLSRSNEDVGFNTMAHLLSSKKEDIGFIDYTVYIWHDSDNSITRRNNGEYAWNKSFVGYAGNISRSINHALKYDINIERVKKHAVHCLCYLYMYYSQIQQKRPEFQEQAWNSCVKFYQDTICQIEDFLSKELIADQLVSAQATSIDKMGPVAPTLTIWQFIKQLKESVV